MPELSRLSTRAWCAALLCVVALAAGCSSTTWDTTDLNDQPPSTVKEYGRDEAGIRESLVDHLSTVGTNLNEWAAPKDQAECAANKIIERLGVDRLLDLGYEPQDGRLSLAYTPEESSAVLNILTNCIDFEAGVFSMLAAYQKLSVDSSRCLAAGMKRLGVTRDLAEGLLRGGEPDPFANDNQFATNVNRAMVQCLDLNEDLLPIIENTPFPQDLGETTTTAGGETTTTTEAFGFPTTTTP